MLLSIRNFFDFLNCCFVGSHKIIPSIVTSHWSWVIQYKYIMSRRWRSRGHWGFLCLKSIWFNVFHLGSFADKFSSDVPGLYEYFLVCIRREIGKGPRTILLLLPVLLELAPRHFFAVKFQLAHQRHIFAPDYWGISVAKLYSSKRPHLMSEPALMLICVGFFNSANSLAAWAHLLANLHSNSRDEIFFVLGCQDHHFLYRLVEFEQLHSAYLNELVEFGV